MSVPGLIASIFARHKADWETPWASLALGTL